MSARADALTAFTFTVVTSVALIALPPPPPCPAAGGGGVFASAAFASADGGGVFESAGGGGGAGGADPATFVAFSISAFASLAIYSVSLILSISSNSP